MKRIYLFILLLIVSIGCIFAQDKQLIGTYYYRHSTNDYSDDYELIEETDSNGVVSFRLGDPLPDDGCCTETATLELKPDFTFFMSFLNDQGDYQVQSEICGVYTLKGDTLTMYSPISPKIKSLEKETKNISKKIFKVSFKNEGWTIGYLLSFLNNNEFYSLDKNFNKKRIEPLYAMLDNDKVEKTRGYQDIDVGINVENIDTVSFVLNRMDIGDYLYYIYKNQDGERVDMFSGGLILKMAGYRYSCFQDFNMHDFFSYSDCEGGINDYSLIIGVSVLKSMYQTFDETGREYYYEFIKKEDKQ